MQNYYDYMNDVKFLSTVKILDIKKKTSAELFKDLKVGDKIIITASLLNMNMMYGAPICRVFNCQNKSIIEKSAKQIYNILRNFDYCVTL